MKKKLEKVSHTLISRYKRLHKKLNSNKLSITQVLRTFYDAIIIVDRGKTTPKDDNRFHHMI